MSALEEAASSEEMGNEGVGAEEQHADYEDRARQMGWAPRDEWRGDPEGWRDAEEFVKRGEEILPIVKDQNKRLLRKMEEMQKTYEGRIAKMQEGIDQFSEFYETVEQRTRETLLNDLRAKKRQALDEDDHDAVVAIDDQIAELRSTPVKKPQATSEKDGATQQPISEEAQAFIDSNRSWFGKDRRMTAFAAALEADLMQEGMGGEELYDEISRELRNTFPDRFGNSRRSQPNAVEGATNGGNQRKAKKSFDTLPADGKKAYSDFVSLGIIKDSVEAKARYAAEYYRGE